jgi:hypothetical protein
VDVDAIRSRFIQENLRRALAAQDREWAARALRAFRNYFQWFESRLPDVEKLNIRRQLEHLAQGLPEESAEVPSSNPYRVSAQ